MLRDWILAEGQIIFSREILSLRLMDAPNLSSNYKNALWDERGSAFWGQIYEERVTARCCVGDVMGTFSGPRAPGTSRRASAEPSFQSRYQNAVDRRTPAHLEM